MSTFDQFTTPILGYQVGMLYVGMQATTTDIIQFGIYGPIPKEANAAIIQCIADADGSADVFVYRLDGAIGETDGFVAGLNPYNGQPDPLFLTNREQIDRFVMRYYNPTSSLLIIQFFTGHQGSTR